jgi:hypothetical protein
MDPSEAYDFFNSRRRRDEKRRRPVEAAVEGLIRHYGLLPEKARATLPMAITPIRKNGSPSYATRLLTKTNSTKSKRSK